MLINIDSLVKIRIIDPPKHHKEYLEQEYHFIEESTFTDNKIDAVITFRDDLCMDLKHQAVVEAPVGYNGQGVFWFDPNHNLAIIDFHNFGYDQATLVVSKQFNSHFLYILILYLISFFMLKSKGTFCHASAVNYKDKNILLPAWRHVGKTNLLLSFLQDGGELISDDGVLLFEDGTFMPYSKRMHLLYFNLAAYPDLVTIIPPNIQTLFQFVEYARNGIYEISDSSIEQLQKLIRARVTYDTITGKTHMPKRYQCDVAIHLNKQANKDVLVKLDYINIDKLAVKTTEATLFELTHFLSAYHIYKLTCAKSVDCLDNAAKSIYNIFLKGFSKANCYELTFGKDFCNETAKRMVVERLHETQGCSYNTSAN